MSSRSTASLGCLLSKRSESRSALPTDSHTSPPPSLKRGGNDELQPNTAEIYKNIPVSVTKLMLGLRVSSISSHLTADKLFPVNPRTITGPPKMSLLLEAKSMLALIIKPRLILVTHSDDLGWYIKSNQLGQMFVKNLNRIVSKPNATPGQILYCTTDCIPVDLTFQENFPTITQVWNRLSHRNDCQQRGVIWVTYRCYNSSRTRSGTSVIRRSSVPPRALSRLAMLPYGLDSILPNYLPTC